MKHKLLTLFVALTIATTLFASNTQVDGIWYDFDNTNLTASVTYRGNLYYEYENEYTGSVVVPETVTYNSTTYSVSTIGDYAFYNCRGLTSVTIPNSVTTIGYEAFYYCKGLTSVTIGSSVTTIGFAAFSSCSGLTSITIPNSVTTIGGSAFSGCSGLTSVTIPNSVITIGGGAFAHCNGLTSIIVDAANTHYCAVDGVLFNYAKDTLVQYPIGNTRTEYTIPNSVTTIGYDAFFACSGLTSVTIPNSVTTIGDGAFFDCTGLNSVTIPNSVITIGDYAFSDCSGLTKTNYTGTIADWCKIQFGSWLANPISFSHNFFINDVEVKDLVIPEGVDTIGKYAFCFCEGLTSVTIPNSVTTIGDDAFSGCSGLTSVTIPNSVTTIGEGAFCYCEGLTSVTIPNSVTTIGEGAFCYCEGLTSVTIPNSVTTIGFAAFYKCSSLTSVTIPNSVTTIGESAFEGCTGLTSVTIPNSVTEIGDGAFRDCIGLTSITCYATTPPTCGSYCFDNVDKTIPVYVPARSVDAYRQADIWREFTNKLPISAESVPSTDDIITQPSTNSVTITWPANDNAEEYKLVITKDGIVFCTLTFNAQGQLTGIAFAPNRAGSRMLDAAVMTANGWQFTVTGLDQASKYGYALDALNASKQSIKHYEGEFATDGYTSLEWVTSDKIQGINKILLDGNLYILRDGNLFTATGARVK